MKKYVIGTLGVQPVAPHPKPGANVQLPSVELQVSNKIIKEPEAESEKVLMTLKTLCYSFVVTVLKTR